MTRIAQTYESPVGIYGWGVFVASPLDTVARGVGEAETGVSGVTSFVAIGGCATGGWVVALGVLSIGVEEALVTTGAAVGALGVAGSGWSWVAVALGVLVAFG